MTKVAKKTVTKKDAGFTGLQFWNKDEKKPIDYDYLIPATEEIDGIMYAKINLRREVNKKKDTFSLVLSLGETLKEIFIGASSNTLGRTFAFPPEVRESRNSEKHSEVC